MRRRYLLRRQNILALTMIGLILFAALAAPALSAPGDMDPPDFKRVGRAADHVPQPPRPGAPLGTVGGQYDVLHTVLWGTRSALSFGLIIALASATTRPKNRAERVPHSTVCRTSNWPPTVPSGAPGRGGWGT